MLFYERLNIRQTCFRSLLLLKYAFTFFVKQAGTILVKGDEANRAFFQEGVTKAGFYNLIQLLVVFELCHSNFKPLSW